MARTTVRRHVYLFVRILLNYEYKNTIRLVLCCNWFTASCALFKVTRLYRKGIPRWGRGRVFLIRKKSYTSVTEAD